MFYKDAFVAALVTVVILKYGHKVVRHELNGKKGIVRIPEALVFSYCNVTTQLVLLRKHTLKHVDQIIQVPQLSAEISFLFLVFSNATVTQLEHK